MINLPFAKSNETWLTGPFPEGAMIFERMVAHESIGQPFEIEIDALTSLPSVTVDGFLGQSMTVHLDLHGKGSRPWNGIITQLAHAGSTRKHSRYRFVLRPWLALLQHRVNSRIFQDKTAVEVIQEIFQEHGFPFDLNISGSYRSWEYLVQYRESDFNFVSRLMEQEGLYYFFEHTDGKHTLVLADAPSSLPPIDGYAQVPLYDIDARQARMRDHLDSWGLSWRITPGRFAARDFNFTNPRGDLLATLEMPKNHAHAKFEVFEYPGEYVDRGQGEDLVRHNLERLQSQHEAARGSGNARGVKTGARLQLEQLNFSVGDAIKEYLVLQTSYNLEAASIEAHAGDLTTEEPVLNCRVSLVAIDAKVPFRLPIATPKPVVAGPQTAIVVGKAGEEIWTDQYGRVKLQFHWDRVGGSDEKSSCWVRVAQVWAGSRWGAMHIPRIGQEVIVDFLEGDPDRPIVTGRVYNADNMPPYDLAANQTQSGIKSRSSKGGGPDNFNEIRFEDKKGEEELFVQAEKDQRTLVKNDQRLEVNNNRHKTVGVDEINEIKGTRSTTVTKAETQTYEATRVITVAKTDNLTVTGQHTGTYESGRNVTVEKADQTTVTGGNKTTTVDAEYNISADKQFRVEQNKEQILLKDDVIVVQSGDSIEIKNDKVAIAIKGGKLTINASDEIALSCGQSSIVMKKDGTISIKGGKQVTATGSSSKLNLDSGGGSIN